MWVWLFLLPFGVWIVKKKMPNLAFILLFEKSIFKWSVQQNNSLYIQSVLKCDIICKSNSITDLNAWRTEMVQLSYNIFQFFVTMQCYIRWAYIVLSSFLLYISCLQMLTYVSIHRFQTSAFCSVCIYECVCVCVCDRESQVFFCLLINQNPLPLYFIFECVNIFNIFCIIQV